jgi:hypothetical protein
VFNSDLESNTAKSIILGNENWIGGGLFLGKPDVLTKFVIMKAYNFKDGVYFFII